MPNRMNAQVVYHILDNVDVSVAVSDPLREDHPLIYVNDAFCKLSGYKYEECLGNNCRFLQGPDTDPEAVEKIRQSLKDGTILRVEILNYKKDGTPFWNELNLYPVRDANGKPMNFLAMQFEADSKRAHKKKILSDVMSVMDL